MDWIKNWLLDLTPSKSFRLFLVALVVSAGGLVLDFGRPWSVVVPVAAYGCVLCYAQRRLFVALNGTLKDSPYFLGFIITLGGLVRLFWITAGRAASLSVDPGPLVHDLAEALATTVTGLLFRQALQSLDPGEAARDAAFQTLVTSIRQNAADFYQAQQHLVALVKEFVNAREDIFASEQAAHSRYVNSLSSSASVLSDLQRAWPEQLGVLQESTKNAARGLSEIADSYAAVVKSTSDVLTDAVAKAGVDLRVATRESAEALRTAEGALEERIDSIAVVLRSSEGSIRAGAEAFVTTMSSYPDESARLAEALAQTRIQLEELRGQVAGIAAEIGGASQAVATTGAVMKSTQTEISALRDTAVKAASDSLTETRQFTSEINLQARQILGDLQATDAIAEQVIEILRTRIEQLNLSQNEIGRFEARR
jgi:hypothetical protein